MSFFPWAMIFVGLGVVGLAALALVGLRLWRRLKALGHDVARAGETFSALGSSGRGGMFDPE